MRTSPKALLRFVRQRWAIDNEWHCVRAVQLDEHANRYAESIRRSDSGATAPTGLQPAAGQWLPLHQGWIDGHDPLYQ